MYVTRLAIDDFKAYASVEVELQPLTLILGPNGSGKTSVLQAFELLAGLVDSTIKDTLGKREWDFKDLSHLKTSGKQFGFEVEFSGESDLKWRIRLGAKKGPGVASETVSSGDTRLLKRVWRTMSRLDHVTGEWEEITQTLTQSWLSAVTEEDVDRFPELARVAAWARGVLGYIELQPARLRSTSRRATSVGRDGGDLAGFLAFLKNKHPERFQAVVAEVRRVYPRLMDVDVKVQSAGWCKIAIIERWGKKSLSLNARQVSDGLLRLLAVAAMAHSPTPASLVMIDEIENGLHPHLLGALMELLQVLADSGTQVVATTHSPIALNYVRDASQVLISARSRGLGTAHLIPMSDAPGFKRLNSALDPGEAWYNLGEDRLLGKLLDG